MTELDLLYPKMIFYNEEIYHIKTSDKYKRKVVNSIHGVQFYNYIALLEKYKRLEYLKEKKEK